MVGGRAGGDSGRRLVHLAELVWVEAVYHSLKSRAGVTLQMLLAYSYSLLADLVNSIDITLAGRDASLSPFMDSGFARLARRKFFSSALQLHGGFARADIHSVA